MKISKLFHWLYAFLMFLPVIFILPTLLYFGFNKNAIVEEKIDEIGLNYSTNVVNSQADLVEGNVYTFTYNANPSSFPSSGPFYWDAYFYVSGTSGSNSTNYGPRYNCFMFSGYSLDIYTENEWLRSVNDGFVFDFVYSGNPNSNWPISMISECPRSYPNGNTATFIYPGIVGDVEKEFNDIFEMPLFSWTSNNFISVPFTYLTSLFGIAANSVINKYLCYWLSISVIWLCFDVIIYVPLLVHRWLDKGIVE